MPSQEIMQVPCALGGQSTGFPLQCHSSTKQKLRNHWARAFSNSFNILAAIIFENIWSNALHNPIHHTNTYFIYVSAPILQPEMGFVVVVKVRNNNNHILCHYTECIAWTEFEICGERNVKQYGTNFRKIFNLFFNNHTLNVRNNSSNSC